MTLLELYEPLFQYVCTLNRIGRNGGHLDYSSVRFEINNKLQEVMDRARQEGRLQIQADKLRKPAIFFVDYMISNSKLPFAIEWAEKRRAWEPDVNIWTGDRDFLRELDATLQDTSEDATERLTFFYVCLGLGFVGDIAGHAHELGIKEEKYLRETMQRIFIRIKHIVETDPHAPITRDAYFVDPRNLTEPPSRKVVLMSIVFAVCAVTVLFLYGFMYHLAKEDFTTAVNTILSKQPKGTAP